MVMKEIGTGLGIIAGASMAAGCAAIQYVEPKHEAEYQVFKDMFAKEFGGLSEEEAKQLRFGYSRGEDGFHVFAYLEKDGKKGLGAQETKLAVKRMALETYLEHFASVEEKREWKNKTEAGEEKLQNLVKDYNGFAAKALAADKNISLKDHEELMAYKKKIEDMLKDESCWSTETRKGLLELKGHLEKITEIYIAQAVHAYELGCAATDGAQRSNLSYTKDHKQLITAAPAGYASIDDYVKDVLKEEKFGEVRKEAVAEWTSTEGDPKKFEAMWTRIHLKQFLDLARNGKVGVGTSEYPLANMPKEQPNGDVSMGSGRTLLEHTTAIRAHNQGAPLTEAQVKDISFKQKTVPNSGKQ